MKITGQYSTLGDFLPFSEPREVYQFGNTLRDSDGFVVAMLDEYGDWVSANMRCLGLKSKMEVVE